MRFLVQRLPSSKPMPELTRRQTATARRLATSPTANTSSVHWTSPAPNTHRWSRGRGRDNARRTTDVLILGGVHGNESLGVRVVERLIDLCSNAEWEDNSAQPSLLGDSGTLTLGLGNLEAIELGVRGTDDDLNRCFRPSLVDGDEEAVSGEERRALELAPLIRDCSVLIDLHATNKPSEPFIRVAGEFTKRHLELCSMLPCDTLVLDPYLTISGGISTTDEYCGHHGGIGLCYESGQAKDMESTDKVLASVLGLLRSQIGLELRAAGAFERTLRENRRDGHHAVYEMFEAVYLTEAGFTFANGMGTHNFQRVPAGAPIGWHIDDSRSRGSDSPSPPRALSHQQHQEAIVHHANEDCYLLFPKVAELWRLGKPIVWLCRKRGLQDVVLL
eukprot:TRINITY_DN60243_c0_g1_i1.p1 TRINITY_DN60243_c0_g1~~TRINITY_DN60243_c0_g1_i1.p1  ORF type:complete len:389 (+),score=64.04 TRINITY_DN60243_c0_g1_i1:118-1284(+)